MRVLISKILLPSLANVGMIGLVRPAPPPAALAPPGSAISSESDEAFSGLSSASSLLSVEPSSLASAVSPGVATDVDAVFCCVVVVCGVFFVGAEVADHCARPALCPSGRCLPLEKSSWYSLTIPDSPGLGPGFFLRERNTFKEPIGVDQALLF